MVQTYDSSARKLAEYFKGIGSRTMDVELIQAFLDPKPNIVEVGCGDGRDSVELAKIAGSFTAFDISEGMIEIAQERMPDGDFEVADMESYDFPQGTDAVVGFASFLHVPKEAFTDIAQKVHAALNDGGLLYVSVKKRDSYQGEVKVDDFGERLFYFYDLPTLREVVGDQFEELYIDEQKIGNTEWYSVLWRKQ